MERPRAVAVGDALLPTQHIVDALSELGDRLEIVASLDFGPPSEAELDRVALRLERRGPSAEPPPPSLIECIREAEILVVHYCPVGEAVLDQAPNLRILATCRAGTENLDVAAALDRGLLVLRAIGRTTEAVSDFAIGLLLAEIRNIARAHHRVVAGSWDKAFSNSAFTPELSSMTVGIVGFGEIGRIVARKLQGFGPRIMVHDPAVSDETMRTAGVVPSALEELLGESDAVTLHARPEDGAPPVIGARQLSLMKPTSVLVNTARAALIDTDALVAALREGRIAGAALDVYDEEPLGADHPLVSFPNVTLTPHLASSTRDCLLKSPRIIAEDLGRALAGQEPRHALDPGIAGRWDLSSSRQGER